MISLRFFHRNDPDFGRMLLDVSYEGRNWRNVPILNPEIAFSGDCLNVSAR
jgi:hypothetical protein